MLRDAMWLFLSPCDTHGLEATALNVSSCHTSSLQEEKDFETRLMDLLLAEDMDSDNIAPSN